MFLSYVAFVINTNSDSKEGRMSVSQKTVGGNSCGACAASYAVQEFLNKVLTASEIRSLWDDVKFDATLGSGEILKGSGIQYDHTDPTKLGKKLTKYGLRVTLYRSKNSALNGTDAILADSASLKNDQEGMNAILDGNRRAIGIYKVATVGLHYILTKFADNKYWIKDSNAKFPEYVQGPTLMSGKTPFSADVDGVGFSYQYLGACIVVGK
jgi:hypothetical protein